MRTGYSRLDWDSDFFGFNVFDVNEPIESSDEWEEMKSIFSHQNVHLAYYSFEKPLKLFSNYDGRFVIKLVDKKTTYVKKLGNVSGECPSVVSYKEVSPGQKLVDLAIASGIYSRYNVDEKVGREKFEELYRLWINDSVNRKIANEVLVFKEKNQICGFVTLGEKNERGNIGLIAVDSSCRRKGVGKMLMKASENWFINQGYDSLDVVTQGDNKPACRFYDSCGYHIESVRYFYHIWRNEDCKYQG